jgi:hypothetical protein
MLAPGRGVLKHIEDLPETGATGADVPRSRPVIIRERFSSRGERDRLEPAVRALTQNGNPGNDDRRDESEHDRVFDGRRTMVLFRLKAEESPRGLRSRCEA